MYHIRAIIIHNHVLIHALHQFYSLSIFYYVFITKTQFLKFLTILTFASLFFNSDRTIMPHGFSCPFLLFLLHNGMRFHPTHPTLTLTTFPDAFQFLFMIRSNSPSPSASIPITWWWQLNIVAECWVQCWLNCAVECKGNCVVDCRWVCVFLLLPKCGRMLDSSLVSNLWCKHKRLITIMLTMCSKGCWFSYCRQVPGLGGHFSVNLTRILP